MVITCFKKFCYTEVLFVIAFDVIFQSLQNFTKQKLMVQKEDEKSGNYNYTTEKT